MGGGVFALIAEIGQGVHPVVGNEQYAAALAAVAAVGTARRDKFLAMERDRAVAAVACLDFNDGFIDNH